MATATTTATNLVEAQPRAERGKNEARRVRRGLGEQRHAEPGGDQLAAGMKS